MNDRTEASEALEALRARRVGVEAVADAVQFDQATPPVQIALYVNGRLINTHTDSATVQRIMSILTGLEA